MADTYTQIYLQLVFAVQGRIPLIQDHIRDELEKYICGIIKAHKAKVYAIYCNPDHIHILVSANPRLSVSELVKLIKSNSAKWLNEKREIREKFRWQYGYGAFSYAHNSLDNVIHYIENQEEHHKVFTFKEEYELLLKEFKINYQERNLFSFDVDEN
ncbi:MAG: IS200/IS605 family transposase [Bacteroidota bacterium]